MMSPGSQDLTKSLQLRRHGMESYMTAVASIDRLMGLRS